MIHRCCLYLTALFFFTHNSFSSSYSPSLCSWDFIEKAPAAQVESMLEIEDCLRRLLYNETSLSTTMEVAKRQKSSSWLDKNFGFDNKLKSSFAYIGLFFGLLLLGFLAYYAWNSYVAYKAKQQKKVSGVRKYLQQLELSLKKV